MSIIQTYNTGILGDMDATEIASKIKAGEISSEEAVACAIARAKEADGVLNAIVNHNYKQAQENSRHATTGVFAGVPSFIKDLNDVKGFPTLKGCSGLKVIPSKKNDEIVDQFLATTGSIILGKTSTSEFGLLPCGETLQHGETRNPWNTEYSTGGSSAGAAAMVASGVVPFAHASDGGGSIRIPASCCGLVGLKPTRGRNITSRTKNVPVDIAQDGMLSRSVRDTANFWAALENYYSNSKLPKIGLVEGASNKRLRVALFTNAPGGAESDNDVKDAVYDAGKLLEQLGHEVDYIQNPFDHSVIRDFLVYWSFLSFGAMASEYAANGLNFNHTRTAKFTKDLGRFFPLISFRMPGSIKRLKEHTNDYNDLFKSYDVLVSPVLSHPAPPIGYFGTEVDTLEVITKLNGYVNFTTTQNITGAPAISLPLGISRNGLPIGVQFAARSGEERKLLELAFEIEEANPFLSIVKLQAEKSR